jgi:site-specific recombinase XerD
LFFCSQILTFVPGAVPQITLSTVPEMSYSIKAVTKGHVNKDGKTKIFIQVIYQRMKVYAATIVQEPVDKDGNIAKHSLSKRYADIVNEQKNEIEKRLLEALRRNKDLSKEQLEEVVKGKTASAETIEDYIYQLVDELGGKISTGRVKQYKGVATKLHAFQRGAKLSAISVKWLNQFEAWLRKQPGREPDALMEGNTVQTKMKILHAVCVHAKKAGLIDEAQYQGYQMPTYEQKLPDYLTEEEMAKLQDLLQNMDRPGHQLAGYYFLLSCYAGYRISDLKKFKYEDRVKGGRIILRTKKNKKIVSIILHTRLQKVLDYIKDKPLYLSEQKMRDYVKDLSKNIGISRKIKVHTARHSFGMLLAENGFSLDEAAELLGDSKDVARVYFRMSNKRLDDKVRERLG